MKLPRWLRRVLGRDATEWPPQREYEWRSEHRMPYGRTKSINACLFHLAAHERGEAMTSTDSVPVNPNRIIYLTVVATGERVDIEILKGGWRRLANEPDLPRFR